MSLIRHVVAGLRALLFKRDVDRELDDEVRQYIDVATQEHMRAGMSREQAERAARVDFGGMEAVKETVRGAGWEAWVDAAWRDVSYAARSLAKSPAFTITAIATLALGIGANTAMFSLINAVLLRPLPYADPDRLTTLWTDDARHGDHEEGTSNLNFLDWRARSRSFADMAVCSRGSPAMLGGSEPERLNGEDISANLLSLLGVQPLLGRNITRDEEWRGETAILSYGLWQRRFGARPDVIGQTIELDGARVRIVGVMARGFFFPTQATQLWTSGTLSERERTQRTQDTWRVVGRLKPGVTLAQAQSEMSAIGGQLAREFPTQDPGFAGYSVRVVPMLAQVTGDSLAFSLWLLLGAVALVLAIACVNVANLLLVRGVTRGHELAIRTALGASRARLIRQLAAESLLLSGAGAVLAIGLAVVLLRLLPTWAAGMPRVDEVGIDARVLAFTASLSLGSAILFGLAPVWRNSRREPIDALRDGGRSSGHGTRIRRVRASLVVTECAIAVVLLVGACVLVRGLVMLGDVDSGFRPDGALLVRVAVPPPAGEAQQQRSRRGDDRMAHIVERLRSLPDVHAVGAIRDFVFNKNPDWVITAEGSGSSTIEAPSGPLTSEYVSPGFFAAVGATIIAGREFDARTLEPAGAVMINEALARRYFPGVNPVGKRFKEGGQSSRSGWLTVIGVVRDMHRGGLERGTIPEYYTSWYAGNMDIVVRSDAAVTLSATVRQVIRATEPQAAITRIVPLADEFAGTGAERRVQTLLLAAFATVALLMAAVGMYGVLSFVVSGRTREIAVRVALGARTIDALSMVVGEGMRLAAGGVAIGVVAALGLARLMSHVVFGVSPRDPGSIIAATTVLLAAAFVACYVPARRAARIDPMTALRQE